MLLKSTNDALNLKNYFTSIAGWTRFEFLIGNFSHIPLKDCKKPNIQSNKSEMLCSKQKLYIALNYLLHNYHGYT